MIVFLYIWLFKFNLFSPFISTFKNIQHHAWDLHFILLEQHNSRLLSLRVGPGAFQV
jgi:hypothetical protein